MTQPAIIDHAIPDKEEVRAEWTSRAHYWDRWADQVADMADRFNAPLLDALELRPGQRVLDLACGTGEPALSAARRVAPGGHVVATDLVPAMLDSVRRRAGDLGIANLTCEQADMERLPFSDARFDRATCRFGIMFVPDAIGALREARRVLAPGGRMGLLVWGPIEDTTIMTAIRAAARKVLGADGRQFEHPFRFGAEGALDTALRAAGFQAVKERALRFTPEIPADRPFWQPMLEMTLGARIDGAGADARARLDGEIHTQLAGYLDGDRYRFQVHVRLATGAA
ncbi:MAG: class I SAM-dependent methyltransferase [Alphaproteobacteria bacterium]